MENVGAPIDVDGFRHVVLARDIRHAIKQHGDAAQEARRGQLAITADDIASIPVIVESFNTITARKRKSAPPTIRYEKQFPDGLVYMVEEVRRGKGELAFKTMLKKRPDGGPTRPDVPPSPAAPGVNVRDGVATTGTGDIGGTSAQFNLGGRPARPTPGPGSAPRVRGRSVPRAA